MRIAVITPYFKEADTVLRQCHESVRDQTVACDHFLVADGFPNPISEEWQAKRITLPMPHADNGNTPRVVGGLCALNSGYDAIAFLDADNWFRPDHLERMVALHRGTGAAVCTSNRSMHRPDGSYMFDDDKNDGRIHVDTSCLFMTRAILPVLCRWGAMPKELGPICDTVYWGTIQREKMTCAHDPAPTVCFRTTYEADFHRVAEALPEGVKTLRMTMMPIQWWKGLPAVERRRITKALGWPPGLRAGLARRLAMLTATLFAKAGG